MILKTPISFTLEELFEPEEDPVIPLPAPPIIITPENERSLITKPIRLAPRYYIIIHPPKSVTNDISYISKPYKYEIPWKGPYKNQVRLALPPTVGWGEGSCYTIEYFEYVPIVFPDNYVRIGGAKDKHLKTEYWLVPHVSGRYLLNYLLLDSPYLMRSIPSRVKETKELTYSVAPLDISLNDDLTFNRDLIDIIEITPELPYRLRRIIDPNVTLIDRVINWKNPIGLSIEVDTALDTIFTITYVKPISNKQVVFKNSQFPGNIYIDYNTLTNGSYSFSY